MTQITKVYAPKINPVVNGAPYATINPMTQIVVTNGASQALALACTALLSEKDEVILFQPAFDIYASAVRLAGATPVSINLTFRHRQPDDITTLTSNDLQLDIDEFVSKLSPRTRMVILNSPHNPTGKVFARHELEAIEHAIGKHAPQCIVLSDEVYEHLVYNSCSHIPYASISPSAHDRTLSVYSSGKTFSATGLKVGWIIGPAYMIRDIGLAQQYTTFCVSHTAQIAVAQALEHAALPYEDCADYYTWICALYQRKRDSMVQILQEGGLCPIIPQGAFYVCAHVPQKHPTRKVSGLPHFMRDLVKEGKLDIDENTSDRTDYNICRNFVGLYRIVSIPLSAFFEQVGSGPDDGDDLDLSQNVTRFAFSHNDSVLEEAGKRLRKVL